MKTRMMKILITAFIFSVIAGCSSMTVSEKDQKRSELDAMADKAIADLIEKDPSLKEEIDNSLAYAVVNMKLTKVPIVGGGGGEGVLFNNNQRIYFTVSRFDLGGGMGARSYKGLLTVQSQEVKDQLGDGKWVFEASAEASAGDVSAEGSTDSNTGFTIHILPDGGASATATARVIRISVNKDLMK